MDVLAIIGIITAIVGITAGIVQVLDYIQKRREKRTSGQEQPSPFVKPALQVPRISQHQPDDVYSTYETGLRHLVDRLGQDHPRYSEALTYQQRLSENLAESRRYGDTDTRQAERSQIIEQLNQLALSELGISFSELCSRVIPVVKQELTPRLIPHNLPPRSEFIGREEEKAQIHEALRSRSRLVSIDGIGGIGKTALALEVAYECLRASWGEGLPNGIANFDGFIWATAKDRDLNLDDLLDAIARTLDYPGIAQKMANEKQAAVQKLLQTKPYLLIVDNFETITDESVRDFLRGLPEPSKVLITTRERNLLEARMFSLEHLKETEGLALIRNEGERLGLESVQHVDDHTLLPLYQATGGAPLAAKWAVGQIKQRGQSLDTVLTSLHGAEASIFDHIFARSWDLLSDDARRVLLVMPVFSTSASRAGIEAASEIRNSALVEALGQLVEMSIVDVADELDLEQRRYSIHPLTRAFAAGRLSEESKARYVAQKHLAEFFQVFAAEHGGFWSEKGYAQLEKELPNILATIQWCWEKDQLVSLALDTARHINDFMAIRGHWNDAMDLGRESIVVATERGYRFGAAKFRVWPVGWVYRHRGDLDSAEEQVTRALDEFERLKEERWSAHTKRQLGRIFQERGELDQAKQLFEEALAFFQLHHDERHIYRATANIAEVLLQQGDPDTAWELCHGVLASARQFNDPERLAHILNVLGEVARRRGDIKQAKEFWEEALSHMERADRRDEIANCQFRLAQIEMEMGQEQSAEQRLSQALETYRRLDIQTKVQEAEALLAKLPAPPDREA